MSRLQTKASGCRVVSVAAGLLLSYAAFAQAPQPYPAPPPVPMQMPAVPMADPAQQVAADPRQGSVRKAFANTLLTLLNGAVAVGTAGTSQLVTGAISGWFNRKTLQAGGAGYAQQPYGAYSQQGYPPQGYPQQSYPQNPTSQAYPPTGAQSAYPTTSYPTAATSSYPTTSYPTTAAPGYPTTSYPGATTPTDGTYAVSAPTTYYDPTTGAAAGAGQYSQIGATDSSTLYAGLAYEVHAVSANGTSFPVNPATYEFRTGDKFIVQYRPSMPGRMNVYNVNPSGMQTQIDSVEMAAGQLSTLGPYQFANTKGEESLRMVLSPCSTPQLLTATRDIVNASDSSYATGAPTTAYPPSAYPSNAYTSAPQLGSCTTVASRSVGSPNGRNGVQTRDIRNVALDNGTSFALDPVSQQELSAGSVVPREVTIAFHHR